ncbi:MAG: FecR domain-containing protein [Bacteroidales bacterium]|nr:FecR domain-containing protein [Bacteroidales bacterium]MDD3989266.1 FecR domain-containing protein [Bacteroidales bacterium]MDD4639089.1 FecR domain-containing protein [Bacteroidales bacterium]
MKSRFYNDKRTSAAWDSLVNRFREEGLIQEYGGKKIRFPVYSTLRVAAVVIAVATISLFAIKNLREKGTEGITVQNRDLNTVFVTTLHDGSAVYLSGNASITYPRRFTEDQREVTLNGDAYFQVEPDKEVPFVVNAGLIKVEVLGTSFRVGSVSGDRQSLAVESGRVMVTLLCSGLSTEIYAGEELLVTGETMKKIPAFDPLQFELYTRRIYFRDEKLSDVVQIINRNISGIIIEIDPSVRDRVLTATFCDNSPEAMAKLIALALELSVSIQGDVIKIY